ncbi:hypothetical protein [Nonomuraea sp. B5E05]|uniref:hypothetical protein n=1 Tax=Nonomuraea sp. B5E05 TaxID=3153569 RepID=UPI00325FF930
MTTPRSQSLARLATPSRDDQPDVVPVAFEFDGTCFWVGGSGQDVLRSSAIPGGTPQGGLVVDDMVSFDPFVARGVRV